MWVIFCFFSCSKDSEDPSPQSEVTNQFLSSSELILSQTKSNLSLINQDLMDLALASSHSATAGGKKLRIGLVILRLTDLEAFAGTLDTLLNLALEV